MVLRPLVTIPKAGYLSRRSSSTDWAYSTREDQEQWRFRQSLRRITRGTEGRTQEMEDWKDRPLSGRQSSYQRPQ